MLKSSMMIDIWKTIENIISGFFAIIPQALYFLYASIASLLDVFQLILRKLVGLDVYYIKDPSTGIVAEESGDVLTNIIEGILGINKGYSALSTVFWSLIIFGAIVLVLATIFSVIKAHYNYDDKKSNPFTIIRNSLKSLAAMAITPLVVIFGLYLSEIFLTALDSITNPKTNTEISTVYEKEAMANIKGLTIDEDTVYYTQYDMFGVTEWTNTTTFSGMMFEVMASSANRVRHGSYTATKTVANSSWDNCQIFYANTDVNAQERVAEQIDYAFINCLKLSNPQRVKIEGDEAISVIASTLTYGPSAAFNAGLIKVEEFSKFNVGLVWYYYNLWSANFLLGFVGIISIMVFFINIIFGLVKRLLICIALFLVNAPVIGISPLDGGNGFKEWRKLFVSYFIAGYGAVIGINLFFLILPVLQGISFFNISILDKIFNIIIVVAGLAMVKKFTKLISGFVGGADLGEEGEKLKKSTGTIATKALKATFATVTTGIKVGSFAVSGGTAGAVFKGIKHKITASKMVKSGRAIDKAQAMDFIREDEKKAKEERGITFETKARNLGARLTDGSGALMRTINTPIVKMVAGYMGVAPGPIFEEAQETITKEDGTTETLSVEDTRVYRANKRAESASKYLTDISGATFKAVGNLTGLSNAFKSIKQNGVLDEMKLSTQSFFQAVGLEDNVKVMVAGGSKVSTSKQLEKSNKKATKSYRSSITESALQSKRAASEIFDLAEKFKRRT